MPTPAPRSILSLRRGVIAVALALAAGNATTALGQSNFTGSAPGNPNDWCDPANWDPVGIPGSGVGITIGPNFTVTMFNCANTLRVLGECNSSSPITFWTPVSFSAGGNLRNPSFEFSSTPVPIAGSLGVSGPDTFWRGGIFTGGELRNTGTLTVAPRVFGARPFPRFIDDGAVLVNDGTMVVTVNFGVSNGARLENNATLRFTQTCEIQSTGEFINSGTIESVSLANAVFVGGDFGSTGTLSANGGDLTIDTDFADIAGTLRATDGGTLSIDPGNPNSQLEGACEGDGSIAIEQNLTIGNLSSTTTGPGFGLWFTCPSPLLISGAVTISSGVATWSLGELRGAPGGEEPHVVVAAGARFNLVSTPGNSGPTALRAARVQSPGTIHQFKSIDLLEGASINVPQGGALRINAATLGGDDTGTVTISGELLANPQESQPAALSRNRLRFEGTGKLKALASTFSTGNGDGSGPATEFGPGTDVEISSGAQWRSVGPTTFEQGNHLVSGAGQWRLAPGGRVAVQPGATLDVNLPGTDGFLQEADVFHPGGGVSYIVRNFGTWRWAGGSIDLRPLNPELPEFRNLGFFNVTCSGCQFIGALRNLGPMQVTRSFQFVTPDTLLINENQLRLIGSIDTFVPDAGRIENVAGATILKDSGDASRIVPTLDNQGQVVVSQGTLSILGPIAQFSAIDNELSGGTWTVAAGATLRTTGKIIRRCDPSVSVNLAGSWPEFQLNLNAGGLSIGGTQTSPRPVTNEGEVTLNPNAQWNFTGSTGTYTQTDGTTTLSSNSTLNTGPRPVTLSGGVLAGVGGIVAAALNNTGGTLSPGQSPGTLTVTGNLQQGQDGTLRIEVGGLAPGTQHDQLVVTGSATLGGTLDVRVLPPHQPARGDSHLIVASPSVAGSFHRILQPEGLSPDLRARAVATDLGLELRFTCAADLNGDGIANPDDLSDFITCYFELPPCPLADENGDGIVNPDDLADFITIYFNTPCPF